MTTSAEYAAAYAAVLKIAQADVDRSVPAFFRSEIPDRFIAQFARDASRAALDAASVVREKTNATGA